MIIAKAIIVDRKDNQYKIRIPEFHGMALARDSVPDKELPLASVCIQDKTETSPYDKGDVVFAVSVMEGKIEDWVIVGLLFTGGKAK